MGMSSSCVLRVVLFAGGFRCMNRGVNSLLQVGCGRTLDRSNRRLEEYERVAMDDFEAFSVGEKGFNLGGAFASDLLDLVT
jgi:hypothetical protein